MAYNSFEDLDVWKRGCRQAVTICKAFSSCNNWALRDQIQRSAISVPSNIAEGHERNTDKDNLRFLNYAKASCGELRTQLYIAQGLDLITKEFATPAITETREISSMIQGLSKAIQARTT